MNEDCRHYIKTCSVCQLKAPVTHRDRVPITPILRADRVFDHLFIDCIGPLISVEGQKVKYSYIVDVDGVHKHFHANKLRKFHVRVDSVTCDSLNDDFSKPFDLFVDTSSFAYSAVLTQTNAEGVSVPVAFSSM